MRKLFFLCSSPGLQSRYSVIKASNLLWLLDHHHHRKQHIESNLARRDWCETYHISLQYIKILFFCRFNYVGWHLYIDLWCYVTHDVLSLTPSSSTAFLCLMEGRKKDLNWFTHHYLFIDYRVLAKKSLLIFKAIIID